MSVPQQTLLLAFQHHQAGRLDEAERLYRRLLVEEPAEFNGLHLLGLIEKRKGRVPVGLALIRRSLRITPDFMDALQNLGKTRIEAGDQAGGAIAMERLATLDPASSEALLCLGAAWLRQGRKKEAVQPLRHAIRLRPDVLETRVALSEALLGDLTSLGEAFEESAQQARVAVILSPERGEVYLQMALALYELARHGEALTLCRRALRIRPNLSDARHIAGVNLMLLGDFANGMAESEHRRNNLWFQAESNAVPLWDGSPLPDGTLALYAEGGLGDMIQFVRLVPEAAKRCRQVVVFCPPHTRRLLSTLSNLGTVVINPDTPVLCHRRAMFMSLPHLLGMVPETTPDQVPYLSADAERVAFWRERLRPLTGLRVGICWANGDSRQSVDKKRSIPFELVRPLAEIPNVRLISLHKHDNQAKLLLEGDTHLVHDLGPEMDAGPDAFLDTAAVMMNIDLVLSIDTAVLHLAGALGRPVWMPLGYRACWRWMTDTQTTFWYSNMRIFRQDRPWDWSGPLARITEELRRLAA